MTFGVGDICCCGRIRAIGFWALWLSVLMQIRQLSVGIKFISEFENRNDFFHHHHHPSRPTAPPYGHIQPRDVATPTPLEPTSSEMASSQPTKSHIITLHNKDEIHRNLLRNWKHVEKYEYYLKVPFAIPRTKHDVDGTDAVTVAVHADTGRFNRLLFLINRWNGPVSASILCKSRQDIYNLVEWAASNAQALAWTDIHVLMEDSAVEEKDYPHNLLREMALASVETEYFLALDVDFVTTPNAAKGLQELIRRDEGLRVALHNRTWLVLPAFDRIMADVVGEDQILSVEASQALPENKLQALEMWDKEELEPFHMKKVTWGHGSTNFQNWYISEQARSKELNPATTTRSSFYPISYEIGFEPYVVGCKCGGDGLELPKYWPAFRGYGYNKYTFFVEAYFMGFRYAVLQDFFVVHLPHPYGKRRIKEEMNLELQRFTKHMKENYNITRRQLYDI